VYSPRPIDSDISLRGAQDFCSIGSGAAAEIEDVAAKEFLRTQYRIIIDLDNEPVMACVVDVMHIGSKIEGIR
jgi:hypothetical protein